MQNFTVAFFGVYGGDLLTFLDIAQFGGLAPRLRPIVFVLDQIECQIDHVLNEGVVVAVEFGVAFQNLKNLALAEFAPELCVHLNGLVHVARPNPETRQYYRVSRSRRLSGYSFRHRPAIPVELHPNYL